MDYITEYIKVLLNVKPLLQYIEYITEYMKVLLNDKHDYYSTWYK